MLAVDRISLRKLERILFTKIIKLFHKVNCNKLNGNFKSIIIPVKLSHFIFLLKPEKIQLFLILS